MRMLTALLVLAASHGCNASIDRSTVTYVYTKPHFQGSSGLSVWDMDGGISPGTIQPDLQYKIRVICDRPIVADTDKLPWVRWTLTDGRKWTTSADAAYQKTAKSVEFNILTPDVITGFEILEMNGGDVLGLEGDAPITCSYGTTLGAQNGVIVQNGGELDSKVEVATSVNIVSNANKPESTVLVGMGGGSIAPSVSGELDSPWDPNHRWMWLSPGNTATGLQLSYDPKGLPGGTYTSTVNLTLAFP